MGPRQRDRTCLTSHAHPPPPVVGTLGLWNLTAVPSSFFQAGLRNTVLYLSLFTEDQKLVWRQFPCLALLPLQLVGTVGLRLVWVFM